MSIRYIGSKARVVDAIMNNVGAPDGGVFVDAFSGTGAVAVAAAEAGWPVRVNDNLTSSAIMSYARLLSCADVTFSRFGGYDGVIAELNGLVPTSGFIWKEYSPASINHCTVPRRYFTESNARKIDAAREMVRLWRDADKISFREECVLIADIMRAANRVANTAGTYGCFLSRWQRQSNEALVFEKAALPQVGRAVGMSTVDAGDVECAQGDTAYLDPPYTRRQYAAYYHILETIALGDTPSVGGICGIRPWQDRSSDFCFKVRATEAIVNLVLRIPARRVFLSYSSEGHVSMKSLRIALSEALAGVGEMDVLPLRKIGRYRPNVAASRAGSKVDEVLFRIVKHGNAGRGDATPEGGRGGDAKSVKETRGDDSPVKGRKGGGKQGDAGPVEGGQGEARPADGLPGNGIQTAT